MITELQTLAEKTDALVAVVGALRQENTRLRSQVATLSADQRATQERLQLAAQKIETLLAELPANP